jgi:hemoglobin
LHSGNGEYAEMDRRAARCFAQALDDAGIPGESRLRRTLTGWWAWMTAVMDTDPRSADDVPAGPPLPVWSWDGPVGA